MTNDRSGGDRSDMLITGATGYIGSRVLAALESTQCRIRCLSRNPAYLESRVSSSIRVCRGDVLNAESLGPALAGVETAYYLVHSMGSGGEFESLDRKAAETFGRVAKEQGVRRIIYLGGLGSGAVLSSHLESRQEVGRILRASGVQTLEFRASIILGSASPVIRDDPHIGRSAPVMVTPRWTRTLAQPIAVEDVIEYLIAGLDLEFGRSAVFEIGGADRVSCLELLKEYARLRGLRRAILPVPFLTPRLSSLWLGLVTPVYARVGRKLIDGVRNETVVRDREALRAFDIRPRSAREALVRALSNEDREFAVTRWSDAYPSRENGLRWGGVRFGKRLVDSRATKVRLSVGVTHPCKSLPTLDLRQSQITVTTIV